MFGGETLRTYCWWAVDKDKGAMRSTGVTVQGVTAYGAFDMRRWTCEGSRSGAEDNVRLHPSFWYRYCAGRPVSGRPLGNE